MKIIASSIPLLLLHFVFLFYIPWYASAHSDEDFLQCLSSQFRNFTVSSQVIYTPTDPSYLSVLQFSIQNPRFSTPGTPRPLVIVTPLRDSHIQQTIHCCQKHDIQIRVRSGGHDSEGLSYVSHQKFAVIDLRNMRSITVSAKEKWAWIQAGATLGEVYYSIANKSRTLAFPAGACPTVGVGGHFGGGGYGMMLRKFGLAADHVIDARLIDVNGRILNRKSMGKDLFWAIRGAGSASFGVILAWKIRLVTVPENVTVFTINRLSEPNATKLVHRWQLIADKIDERLVMRIFLRSVNSSQDGKKTILASFVSLFLGGVDELLPLTQQNFPELGLAKEDCTEMSWIESVLYFFPVPSLDDLLDRSYPLKINTKVKLDYVKVPIPESVFEEIWQFFYEEEVQTPLLILQPYGGKMNTIPESKLPFPHRTGNIYHMAYFVMWQEEGTKALERHLSWIRRLYKHMAPYVSTGREAYVNYRDLDIGMNNEGNTSYVQASIWGTKYYKNNFKRLVHVKSLVDPGNFFRNEQSIPPFLPVDNDV